MRKLILLVCVSLVTVATAQAEEKAGKPDSEVEPQWYENLSLGGDLRLRYEGFQWEGHLDDGRRDRFRYRFRLGLDAQVLDNLKLGFQVRSGNPRNPISDNQSLDDAFSKGGISIAEAYADWQAMDSLEILLGKFAPTKLWRGSDLEWDDDVVAEGALEMFTWKPGSSVKSLHLNLYQYVLNESGSSVDSYMFGGQVAPVFAVNDTNELAVGAGFEAITHPEKVAALYFDETVSIDSEHVTNFVDPETGKMISDFRVGNFFVEWKNKSSSRWPIKVSAFVYKNFGAGDGSGVILPVDGGDALTEGRGSDNDLAWLARVQVGDYKKPGDVSFRLSRYDSQPDAVFFAFAQSDTRRSSNTDAWRADLRVGMPKGGHINITWYRTRWNLGDDTAMNRWQFDNTFEF